MAEKTLKTRIALLYKTYAEWEEIKDTFIPLKGEFCICEVPAAAGAVVDEPAILFKAGDNVKTFAQLPWASALAADVYAWAKKENLDFTDLDETFLAELEAFVGEHSLSDEYQMIDSGNGVWKLQKKDKDATEWADVSTVDVAAFVNPLLAKKVDRVIEGTNGKAEIFNESDGGGAKFTHKDGSEAFVGVNDGGKDGLMAQIYADKLNEAGKWEGAKLDVTNEGIYYTVGDKSFAERAVEGNLLVVKSDVDALSEAIEAVDQKADAIKEDVDGILDGSKLDADKVKFDPSQTGDHPMTSTDVEAAIREAWAAIGSGGTAAEVNVIKKAQAEDGYFASYEVTQGGVKVGATINIPKDYLVKSASIKVVTEPDVPYEGAKVGDKYIDFVVNAKDGEGTESHIYLPVNDLVDVYTAGEGIIIGSDNSISVDVETIASVEYVDASITDTMNFIIQERDAEKAARQAGDELLRADLDAEIANRETADTALDAAIKAEETRAKAEEAKKVDKSLVGTKGTSEVFNEADGGGVKFTGEETAFVGVHDNIGGEIGVQAYVDNADGSESTIIDITQNGAYYTKGELKPGSERDIPANEIAVKGDIDAAVADASAEIARLDGRIDEVDEKVDTLRGELADIAFTGNVNDLVQTEGDVLILNCNF